MRVRELAPGLWLWTVPAPGGAGEVAGVYHEAPDAVVLFDPVLPPAGDPERERFWRALDRDVARLRRPVVVLHTAAPGPGGAEVASRYGAGAGASLPGGVDAHPAGPAGEVVYWLPAHAALVAGGALTRDGRGGLRVRPGAEPGLRGLAGLPIERVLMARGEPVLGGGRDVVLRALAGTLA